MNFQKVQKNKQNFDNINTQKNNKTNSTKKQSDKSSKKEKNTKTKKSNTNLSKKSQKIKKPLPPTWKKLEFRISQLTGKIKKNYKKIKIPKYLDKEDIEIILKLISKESKNFSPVKSNTKLTFIFIFLSLASFVFGVFFIFKKKIILGIVLIIVCFFLCFIYIHVIRKSINNKYKKCHQDLFYLTDYINRKYLCDLGYYLLIDYNFKFVGIYTITNYIKEILKFRDHNIELKKQLEGGTINHLYKKPRNKLDKSNSYLNNTFYNNNYYKNIFNTHLHYYTFGYNYNNIYNFTFNKNLNNNSNLNNDITYDEGCIDNNNNAIKDKVKFNNFFQNNDNDNEKKKDNDNISNDDKIKNDDIIIDIPINRRKIRNDTSMSKKEIKSGIDMLNKIEDKKDCKEFSKNKKEYEKYYGNHYEEMNSQVNNRSIDKFKDYIENKYNGLGMLNKYIK